MTTRRKLLKSALLGSAALLGLAARGDEKKEAKDPHKDDDDLAAARAAKGAPAAKADRPLKILILGGTGFLGPHLVEIAKARGHTVTLFNRGKTHPELFPDLEKLRGDRDGKLDALKGRGWDSCIDTSGYAPRIVTQSARLLAPHLKQYQFVSSISVFAEDVKPGADESTPTQTLTEPGSEDRRHYGALKALCEQAAEAALPGRAMNIRPGLIVGPGDPTDRYSYWPVRIDRGGDAIAPGGGDDAVQFVDCRDLAAWMIHSAERNTAGTFNAVGPAHKQVMKELIASCAKAAKAPARLTWVPEAFLDEHKVSAWQDMPVWTGAGSGFSQIDCRKAIGSGLTFRSGDETARDTLAWWKTLPPARTAKLRAGIAPEREKEVLAAWRAKKR